MQREDGNHVLPLPMFQGNPSATSFPGHSDHMVDDTQALGFRLRLGRGLGFGLGIADAIKPVADTLM